MCEQKNRHGLVAAKETNCRLNGRGVSCRVTFLQSQTDFPGEAQVGCSQPQHYKTNRKLGTDVEMSVGFESLTSNGEILWRREGVTNCFLYRNMGPSIKPETRVVEVHLPFLKGKRQIVM